jgi:hypothetical protein
VAYCESTWLEPYKELLVGAWIDEFTHFGHTETSCVEGAHSCLKATLKVSTMDLFATFQRIMIFWDKQLEIYKQLLAVARVNLPSKAYHPFYSQLATRVYPYALNKVIHQYELWRKGGLRPCTMRFTKTWGLPCCHTIKDCDTYGGTLLLSEVHPHWRFDCSDQSDVRDQYREVLDSLPVERRKGRPANQRLTGPAPQTNNRRELSHWEIVTLGYPIPR